MYTYFKTISYVFRTFLQLYIVSLWSIDTHTGSCHQHPSPWWP